MYVRRQVVNKPWGHEVTFAHTAWYVGRIIVIRPWCRLPRQYHEKSDESFYVLHGTMTLEIGRPEDDGFEAVIMDVGGCFHCPPGTIHRMCAGAEGCELIKVSNSILDGSVKIEDPRDL